MPLFLGVKIFHLIFWGIVLAEVQVAYSDLCCQGFSASV